GVSSLKPHPANRSRTGSTSAPVSTYWRSPSLPFYASLEIRMPGIDTLRAVLCHGGKGKSLCAQGIWNSTSTVPDTLCAQTLKESGEGGTLLQGPLPPPPTLALNHHLMHKPMENSHLCGCPWQPALPAALAVFYARCTTCAPVVHQQLAK